MLPMGDMAGALGGMLDPFGRTRRDAYWYGLLIGGLTGAVGNVYDHALWEIGRDSLGPLTAAFIALAAWPFLAMTARRLRDAGVSALWLMLLMVPVAGWLLLLHWTTLPSDPVASGAAVEQEGAAGLPGAMPGR